VRPLLDHGAFKLQYDGKLSEATTQQSTKMTAGRLPAEWSAMVSGNGNRNSPWSTFLK
jgi:hypothetical protein